MKDDHLYYAKRTEQELGLAAAAVNAAVKAAHLDMAARYATLRELSCAPHRKNAAAAAVLDDAIETIRSMSPEIEVP